jgi:hypothetical protein
MLSSVAAVEIDNVRCNCSNEGEEAVSYDIARQTIRISWKEPVQVLTVDRHSVGLSDFETLRVHQGEDHDTPVKARGRQFTRVSRCCFDPRVVRTMDASQQHQAGTGPAMHDCDWQGDGGDRTLEEGHLSSELISGRRPECSNHNGAQASPLTLVKPIFRRVHRQFLSLPSLLLRSSPEGAFKSRDELPAPIRLLGGYP